MSLILSRRYLYIILDQFCIQRSHVVPSMDDLNNSNKNRNSRQKRGVCVRVLKFNKPAVCRRVKLKVVVSIGRTSAIPSSRVLVCPSFSWSTYSFFFILFGVYSHISLEMPASFNLNVLSTCIYNTQKFCVYLLLLHSK
jgi:hypothetical protein